MTVAVGAIPVGGAHRRALGPHIPTPASFPDRKVENSASEYTSPVLLWCCTTGTVPASPVL